MSNEQRMFNTAGPQKVKTKTESQTKTKTAQSKTKAKTTQKGLKTSLKTKPFSKDYIIGNRRILLQYYGAIVVCAMQ